MYESTAGPRPGSLPRARLRIRWGRVLADAASYFLLVVLLIFVLFPFLWIVFTALKPQTETFSFPVRILPQHPTLRAFSQLWTGSRPWGQYFTNSFAVAAATTVLAVSIAGLAAFGFSRFRFRASSTLLLFIIGTQMIPAILLLLSYFRAMSAVGLFNTLSGLVIAYISIALPYAIWILKGYFDSIPKDIDEAALIDGCSYGGVFFRVILPVALPALVAVTIYCFLISWNEFTFAYVLTSTAEKYTASVGLAQLFGEFSTSWSELMAAALVTSLPPIFLYFATSKYLVSGLTSGALK